MQRRAMALVALALILPALAPAGAALADVLPAAPVAEFTFSPEFPTSGMTVTFESTSTAATPIIAREWRFERVDGRSSAMSGEAVERAFVWSNGSGTVRVSHTVIDALGRSSTAERTLEVANSPPVASFIMSPSPAFRGTKVTFDDRSFDIDDEETSTRHWDFGDGSMTTTPGDADHIYTTTGLYTVTLTVQDTVGNTAREQASLRIVNRPPIIEGVTIEPRNVTLGEPATFIMSAIDHDGGGAPLTFSWSFSDGQQHDGDRVTRIFTAAGNHTVTAQAMDEDGGMSAPYVERFFVDTVRPRADITWSPERPVPGQPVSFEDRSATPGSPITSWRWSFGESPSSTSEQPDPTFAYSRNGTFLVALEITDAEGRTSSVERPLVVNAPPIARFSVPPDVSTARPAAFTDLSVDEDGTIISWRWDFGDGTTSIARHPTHTWAAPGAYAVTLTVQDDAGAKAWATQSVIVQNAAPIARWSAAAGGAGWTRNSPLQFVDESYDTDGGIISHDWDFGDGEGSGDQHPTHTFTQSGVFQVGLVVSDGTNTSARTADSHRPLRIAPDHGILVRVTAAAADGRVVDLRSPAYSLRATVVGGSLLSPAAFAPSATGIDVRVEPAQWVNGAILMLRVEGPTLRTPSEVALTLLDGRSEIDVRIALRMALVPAIAIDSSAQPAPLRPLFGDAGTHNGAPVYADPTERIHGTGHVDWRDGHHAAGIVVTIEARYLGIGPTTGAHDDLAVSDTPGNDLVGWCTVTRTVTDHSGDISWAFDGARACSTNGLAGGIYGPGRWEVRGVVTQSDGWTDATGSRTFYVDPTGGPLLAMAGGAV